jgi:hypothetical protein
LEDLDFEEGKKIGSVWVEEEACEDTDNRTSKKDEVGGQGGSFWVDVACYVLHDTSIEKTHCYKDDLRNEKDDPAAVGKGEADTGEEREDEDGGGRKEAGVRVAAQ